MSQKSADCLVGHKIRYLLLMRTAGVRERREHRPDRARRVPALPLPAPTSLLCPQRHLPKIPTALGIVVTYTWLLLKSKQPRIFWFLLSNSDQRLRLRHVIVRHFAMSSSTSTNAICIELFTKEFYGFVHLAPLNVNFEFSELGRQSLPSEIWIK